MPSDVQRRENTGSDMTSPSNRNRANFHDVAARELYTRHYRPIGIGAILASTHQRKAARMAPALHDLPAILRFGPEAE